MNWENIRAEFETSNITMKALAEKYNINPSTLRSRKNREGWQRNDATQRKTNVATKKQNVATEKKSKKSQRNGKKTKKKNKRRSGNPNPENQFSKRNSAALIHGLRSKFLHEEQVEIMELMEGQSVADQLWLQIQINFSSIIRMQKIMFVEDNNDDSRELIGQSWGDKGGGETYTHIFAFEKYESYIKAQTRAMAEQRNLIKQFNELTEEDDERRLKIELMENQVEKSDLEIKEMKASMPGSDDNVDDGFLAAIDQSLDKVWSDENG